MSHICGARGCEYIVDDAERDRYVSERRMEWAQRWFDRRGEFPDTEQQIAFVIRETHAYNQTIGPRLQEARFRDMVERAEIVAREEYMRRIIR
jgi:hypothetical protein